MTLLFFLSDIYWTKNIKIGLLVGLSVLFVVLIIAFIISLKKRKQENIFIESGEIPNDSVKQEPVGRERIADIIAMVTDGAEIVEQGNDTGVIVYNGKEISVRYDRCFTARLLQSDDSVKERYVELKNELLSYAIKPRMSWRNESFYKGRITYAKFAIRGKTLNLYLALNPMDYADTKYFFEDASGTKRYEDVPMRLKIKSNRSVKWAKELICDLATKNEFVRQNEEPLSFVLNFEETKELISRGLIKLLINDVAQNNAKIEKIVGQYVQAEQTEVVEETATTEEPC